MVSSCPLCLCAKKKWVIPCRLLYILISGKNTGCEQIKYQKIYPQMFYAPEDLFAILVGV